MSGGKEWKKEQQNMEEFEGDVGLNMLKLQTLKELVKKKSI